MEYTIKDREPQLLYHYFEELSQIPRVSKNEAKAAEYVISVAERYGFQTYEDDIHNVLVTVPGTEGCEGQPSVLLAAHLDMVGEKTEDSAHDFSKDPVRLVEKGNVLYADHTTLGADNGCGVALMLYIMTAPGLKHPPLELLFTVQEELGLLGAKHFDAGKIRSRRAIGLDAGSEGVLRKGTTDKYEMTSCLTVRREPVQGKTFKLAVDGLRGGDQGAGIPQERICAIKMTSRVLHFLNRIMDVRIISMDKRGKSIPESCTSFVSLEEGTEDEARKLLEEQEHKIRIQYRESDPDIRIRLLPLDTDEIRSVDKGMLIKKDSDNLIEALYLMPYGARHRSLKRLDEVSCSVIMKSIYTDEEGIHVFSVISAEETEDGEALDEEMKTFMTHFGFRIEKTNLNEGWHAEKNSVIRDVMIESYEQLFHCKPKVNISHGGNDCVVLKKKIPDLDLVTTAATYVDFHTPNEHLYMDSFEKVCYLIVRTLENLAAEVKH